MKNIDVITIGRAGVDLYGVDSAPSRSRPQDAITQGADIILLTTSDANLAAGALAAAEAAGVPVVLYDHDAVGGRAEAHVVFDSLSVGQAQGRRAAELIVAMDQDVVRVARIKGNQGEYGTGQYEADQNEFIQPLINSGRVEVVCEQYAQNWDPVLAQSFAEDYLTRTGGNVDVFLGMNDGTTGGSVARHPTDRKSDLLIRTMIDTISKEADQSTIQRTIPFEIITPENV